MSRRWHQLRTWGRPIRCPSARGASRTRRCWKKSPTMRWRTSGRSHAGVVGAIALILALASFAILQVNVAGLALIAFSVLFFIADLKVPGHGVLTIGGILAFFFGALLLTERQSPFLQVSLKLAVFTALLTGAFFLFAVGAGVRAQRTKVRSGREGLVGASGVAR